MEKFSSVSKMLAEVRRQQEIGAIPRQASAEQRIDWAYGNTKIENEDVTMEMARRVVSRTSRRG